MRELKKYSFLKVYDLQNSSRTSFYKKILFPKASKDTWCSTDTTLPEGTTKKDFDKDSVLERFNHQLRNSNIDTKHTKKPDFSWSSSDITQIKNYYKLENFIILFPFCSPHLTSKQWPYYNDLIDLIKKKFEFFKIVVAPGPNEIDEASKIMFEKISSGKVKINIFKKYKLDEVIQAHEDLEGRKILGPAVILP